MSDRTGAFSPAERLGMETALSAARQGVRGANPLVGAVILDADGTVLAIGRHLGAGTPHAEIDALAALGANRRDLSAATLLVTLEPCNHEGRTGPCTQAILDAGVGAVIYAVADPHGTAAGGAARLHRAGLHVRSGLLAAEATELNRRWLAAITAQRPFVTARLAQTVDGRIAAEDGSSQWITSQESRADSHQLRARVDAIVVGTGTVLADNPRLSARDADGVPGVRQPLRVVMGHRSLPADAAIRGDTAPNTNGTPAADPLFLALPTHDPAVVVRELHGRGVGHLMIEGGAQISAAFLAAGLVDELIIYLAPTLLGSGIPALTSLGITTLGDAQPWVWDATLRSGPVQLIGPDVKLTLVPAGTAPPTAEGRHHVYGNH